MSTDSFPNAGDLVRAGFDLYTDYASQAFERAQEELEKLGNLELPESPEPVAYEVPVFTGANLSLPPAPDIPTDIPNISASIPNAPTISSPSVQVGPAPTFSGAQPDLTLPPSPGGITANAPAPFALTPIGDDLPDAPDIVLPAEPTLSADIEIPPVPVLAVPEFTAVPPIVAPDPPALNLDFSVQPYQQRLTEIEAVLRSFLDRLDQRAGMPDEIEQILFERARSRETVIARKAVEEAVQEWSSRGFTLPQGELARRVDEVRARAQDASSVLSRETMIRSHDVRLENLRFAVQQGVVYEGQLIGLHNEQQRLMLETARAVAQLAVEHFNLRIASTNARIAVFNAQAEAYRIRLQQETLKLDLYRGQLEAARLRGDLNEQQVRLYTERVRAQLARVEVYRARIEGFRARVDGVLAEVQQYRGQIDGFIAQVDAKRAEFGLYGEQVRAVAARSDIYRASVQAHAETVRAYQASTEAALVKPRFDLDVARLRIEAYQSQLANIRENVSAQAVSIRARSDAFEAKARTYVALVGAAEAQAQVDQAKWRSEIEASRAAADVAIANLRAISESADRRLAALVEATRATATIQAQIAAGSMSAVNLAAGISGSSSYNESKSKGLSVSYSVDGGESTPPAI